MTALQIILASAAILLFVVCIAFVVALLIMNALISIREPQKWARFRSWLERDFPVFVIVAVFMLIMVGGLISLQELGWMPEESSNCN